MPCQARVNSCSLTEFAIGPSPPAQPTSYGATAFRLRHSKAAGHGLADVPRRVALAVSANSWKDSWKDEAAGGSFELRKEYEHNVLLLSNLR
jgi:hypothetical protein